MSRDVITHASYSGYFQIEDRLSLLRSVVVYSASRKVRPLLSTFRQQQQQLVISEQKPKTYRIDRSKISALQTHNTTKGGAVQKRHAF
jgi:4-hydroxyphenylpyruvate dioxygenase-like putative hemolysin